MIYMPGRDTVAAGGVSLRRGGSSGGCAVRGGVAGVATARQDAAAACRLAEFGGDGVRAGSADCVGGEGDGAVC